MEKRIIFKNTQDYKTFSEILTYYLIPRQKVPSVFSKKPQEIVSRSVNMLCYCLMPNHFHLLLEQTKENGIVKFMNALGITYARYFNKKYNRVGSLFQGRFKAKLIDKDEYLLQLSKYIHLNPREIYQNPLSTYPYSSYRFYLYGGPKEFIDTKTILSYFDSTNKKLSYQSFVEDVDSDFEPIKLLTFE
ncbi:hypothetical protein A3J78_01130 [Candidatus Beckwithbacteria bacterium RBG_13_35_6]|uniref:Transposase IS200-like domain-containing protein n=1 Tax=Candidatus Beckwithbacteria bacterium RBG_13_35_6 TaxID=1797456 RepID=A0A1F5DE53_9BACT|nr:MAG: hypothetical protein A3J78_01130 [Candidatus Beckwithbacteria bacterium RBG_13_35_6]